MLGVQKSFSKFSLKVVKEQSVSYECMKGNLTNTLAVFNILKAIELGNEPEEVFVMIALNQKNSVLGVFEVSRGHLSGTMVHPREVFKRALLLNSARIIVAHNHPSGDTTPSKDDIATTKRLVKAGEILGVEVLDHLIVGYDDDFISLREQRLL